MSLGLKAYEQWLEKSEKIHFPNENRVFISLAGVTIALRFQSALFFKPFLSALSHLIVSVEEADYEIMIWDCCHSGQMFPDFDLGKDAITLRGEIPLYHNETTQFAYFAHARMLHILNRTSKKGIVALYDLNQLPKFELACPFRALFSWILTDNQKTMLHAAALANQDGKGCLILGKSGVGKSSTAISCYLSGMKYIGDDLCILGIEEDKVYVYSLYCSGKTYPSEWAYLPALTHYVEPTRDELFKKEIYFFNRSPDKLCLKAILDRIYIPVKNRADIKKDLPSISALISTCLDSTRDLLPNMGHESFPLISKAFRQARCSYLFLHEDRRCPIPF